MKKLFIVANWKSYKTSSEGLTWLEQASQIKLNLTAITDKEIVVCPAFTELPVIHKAVVDSSLPFKIGAQNISSFDEGQFTGEVNGKQIREFAQYVIIGHSERRKYFNEFDEALTRKVVMAQKYGLMPIYCVQNETTSIPPGVSLVAYEPPSAIGSSNPDNPENANRVAQRIKQQHNEVTFVLYGGSVTSLIVKRFTEMSLIDGVLVGGASLDAFEFVKIVHNA